MRKHQSNFILDTDFVKIIKKYWKYRYILIHIETENFSILTPLKYLLCVKSQLVQGNQKTVPNGKFELKVDFGSVIIFNTSKIMIYYLLLTCIIKSNMIFMNFWHIGEFYWHKLTHGRFYRLEQFIIKIFNFSWN